MQTKWIVNGLLVSCFSLPVFADIQKLPLTQNDTGHFSVQMTVNQKPGHFMVDTGASGTVIDSAKLKKFNIETDSEFFQGMGVGDAESGAVKSREIPLHGVSIEGIKINLDSAYSHDLAQQLGPGFDGILGLDVFISSNTLFDVANASLLIPDSKSAHKEQINTLKSQGYTPLPMETVTLGLHTIDALLHGKPVRLIVDTGAPLFILDAGQLHNLGFETVPHKTARMVDASGNEVPMQVLKNPSISVGKKLFKNDAMVGDLSGLIAFLGNDSELPIVGVIGNQQLTELSSIIDFASVKIWTL